LTGQRFFGGRPPSGISSKEGKSSNGNASSDQYLLMIGWTFGFYVRAHLLDDRLLLGRQDVGELIQVAVRREELRRRFLD
jgi:hypothetical protein